NVPPRFAEFLREPHRAGPFTGLGRVAAGEPFAHIIDMLDDEGYRAGDPVRRAGIELAGARTHLSITLRKDGVLICNFAGFRTEVLPFVEKQIALAQNFAAQAVTAMENARLLGELQVRTAELAERNTAFAERIDHQAATIDVLKEMSASPADAQPVFELIC